MTGETARSLRSRWMILIFIFFLMDVSWVMDADHPLQRWRNFCFVQLERGGESIINISRGLWKLCVNVE